MNKIHGRSQKFQNYYFDSKIHFIYFSIPKLEKRQRNMLINEEEEERKLSFDHNLTIINEDFGVNEFLFQREFNRDGFLL